MAYTSVDPYITLAELREELKMKPEDVVAGSSTEDDLKRAIDNASRWVDDYTQRDYLFHDCLGFGPELSPGGSWGAGGQTDNITTVIGQKYKWVKGANEDSCVDFTAGGSILLATGEYTAKSTQTQVGKAIAQGGVVARTYSLKQCLPTGQLFDQFNDGCYERVIFPRFTPIISVTSILLGSTELVVDTDYFVDNRMPDRQRIISLFGNWAPLRPDRLLEVRGTFGYSQGSPIDHTVPPVGIPPKVKLATRWVAAAISGRNKKEVVGLDGIKQTLEDSKIGKQVFDLLGRRAPVLI